MKLQMSLFLLVLLIGSTSSYGKSREGKPGPKPPVKVVKKIIRLQMPKEVTGMTFSFSKSPSGGAGAKLGRDSKKNAIDLGATKSVKINSNRVVNVKKSNFSTTKSKLALASSGKKIISQKTLSQKAVKQKAVNLNKVSYQNATSKGRAQLINIDRAKAKLIASRKKVLVKSKTLQLSDSKKISQKSSGYQREVSAIKNDQSLANGNSAVLNPSKSVGESLLLNTSKEFVPIYED